MRVLLTGGAGYIGREVARLLRERDEDVFIADCNMDTCKDWAYEWASSAPAREFDDVIHLGALCSVGESARRPRDYYVQNVAETAILAKNMGSDTRIVFASSCAAIGTPISVYGRTKAMCEDIIADSLQHWAILRLYNVAGASDVHHDMAPQTNRIIPAIVEAALGESTLRINGDGSVVRDYVHVCDVAQAIINAMDYLRADNPPLLAEIGTGTGTSINELVDSVQRHLGAATHVEYGKPEPGDAQQAIADPSLARSILKWDHNLTMSHMIASAALHHSAWEARK